MIIKKIRLCTRKELVQILKSHKGRFQGIHWVKKDNTHRRINGRISSINLTELGYLEAKTSKGEFKLIDPRTVYKVTSGNKIYEYKY